MTHTNYSTRVHTSSLCIKTLSGDGINLINEDDGRGIFLRQPEDVTHHTRAFTQVLLNKLRAHHTDERRWRRRDYEECVTKVQYLQKLSHVASY